ncbi:Meckelin [Folsomia candida]|uniref:Meckelin n=1 Tax=Folsomia candida TaxID=158441 RepID=A0A226EQB0_FOLCA|nr:Meckelin [Folsomia candida]
MGKMTFFGGAVFGGVCSLTLLLLVFCSRSPVAGEVGDDLSIKFEEPSRCNLSLNETFSWSSLGCVKCQWEAENSPDYCQCPSGTVWQRTAKRCTKCPDNEMLYDAKHCLECGTANPFSLTLGGCSPCPAGHIEVAYSPDGSPLRRLECTKCGVGFHPSTSQRRCVPCHPSFASGENENGTCRCSEVSHSEFGGVCFTQQELDDPLFDAKSAYKIEYDGFKGQRNQTACQMLGNMCTLNLHTYGEDWTACRLYRIVGRLTPLPNHIPKIYYSEVEAPSVLIRSSTIPHTHDMRYDQSSSDVNITLSKFSFKGQFLGLAAIDDVIPCREPKKVLQIGRKFGTNFKAKCEMNLKDIWDQFNGNTIFLDPYVSYEEVKGKNKQIQLYPVPIKTLNFKRNGIKVNTMDDQYQWQFVRRFFIIDTVGSVEPSSGGDPSTETKIPKNIRYLKSIHISVQLQNSKDAGKIYVPLLTMGYADATQEEFIRNDVITFDYSVNYFMDMSRSIEDVKISIGVLSALAVLWSAIQAWSWNRRNGQLEIDLTTISNLLITACGNLADIFFIVCFATTTFWFVFFKEQVAVHVLLPDMYQERLVRDLIISAFALKIVAIIELIRKQSNIDIFFVDWERPKVTSTVQPKPMESENKPDKLGTGLNSDESVSIWRTYFIANEWNEIQTTRKVHMATQIIATIFFLEVLGFKFWGLHWPNDSVKPDVDVQKYVPFSTSARFVVGTVVFGLIGILQCLYRIGFYERYIKNEIQDFVDLCTMGNISVFILAARQHGYYIHGRSVHGFADTDMQTMIEQLSREEEDLCGRRGLLPQTDQQTFLISVPGVFRSVYSQVLQPLYASSSASSTLFTKNRQLGGSKTATSVGGGVGVKPSSNMLNLSIHAYNSMNRFLTAFLEHALSDLDYDINNKTFFEGLLDMEFNEVGSDRAVFYTDDGHSFDSVLFYGHERTLFLGELYTFIFVDIISHNFVLAGVVVFLVDLMLKAIRNFMGKRNLARKTLIDSRFLI